VDDNVPEAVRINAIKDALDRAGVSARTAVDVSVSGKLYETVFEAMEPGGSRAEYRRSIGMKDDTDVLGPFEANGVDVARSLGMKADDDQSDLIVDAEIDYLIPNGDAQPITSADDERGSPFESEPYSPLAPVAPGKALMPYDEATHAAAV